MKEAIVTIGITEYKRMEAKVLAFDRIESGKIGTMLVYRFGPYIGDWIVIGDEANTLLLSELERVTKERDAAYNKLNATYVDVDQGKPKEGFWKKLFS
jgi:hypothetical protein